MTETRRRLPASVVASQRLSAFLYRPVTDASTAEGKEALRDANLFEEQLPCQDASAGGVLERFNQAGSHKSRGRFRLL